MFKSLSAALAAAVLVSSAAGAQEAVPTPPIAHTLPGGADYGAVLASPVRTDEDRSRDAARMTEATLAFTGVRPGWKVGDMIMGGGFFTRAFSAAVGAEGRVVAWQPAEFIGFSETYARAAEAADQLPNVDVIRSPIGSPEFPAGLDLVFTAQNYHDLHLRPFAEDTAARVNAAVFAALRPGGYYVILDHHAVDGSDLSVADSLHRIDRETVVREVEAAGFQYSSEAAFLWRDDDPRTANVFDDSIRGRTSQFAIVFRKPD
ncbi:methyltransferase [Brevundimonas sp. 2R-24]|uniref:Methyltransferase n=1 Tax=Peiella sedimenti TaxID=3061083 RepID=A0ABT8SL49_9CAUL|nr:methyltransferase [Caulobacteraceae bacterium XZ-24]